MHERGMEEGGTYIPFPFPLGPFIDLQQWSAGEGWTSQTSPEYPARWPEATASATSWATQRAPRAVLTNQVPFFM